MAKDKTNQRVTLYRDPLNEQERIVASDYGDPSEEHVLLVHEDYEVAARTAQSVARKRGCPLMEETVELL